MRILLLSEARCTHTQRWAKALAGRDWEIVLLSESEHPLENIRAIKLQTPPLGLRFPQGWWGRRIKFLKSTIAQVQPDIIHMHYLQDLPLEGLQGVESNAPRSTNPTGPPLVISTWGADIIQDDTVPIDTADQRTRKIELLHGASAVTSTTQFLAGKTACYAGIDENDITVIPFGVDLKKFAPPSGESSSKIRRVGFVKHLLPKYGPDLFIRSMPLVLEKFPETRFVIVGEGPQEHDLKKLAQELRVGSAIEWKGFVENDRIPALLTSLHAMVMPSISESETFGVSAVEAQAVGVPVVFSNLPGVREAIIDNIGGLAVPPGNSDTLAEAVCRLMSDPVLHKRLSIGARQTVQGRFDFDENVTQMDRVYQEVMAQCPSVAV